jgi:diguanylate cyclase (GGDEF)-like protein/PAS domain S-box-containing protein
MFLTAQQEANQRHRGLVQRTLPTHRRRMIRALIVEDDLADVELCLQELKRAQFAISADVVKTQADFIERLRVGPYDVVLATASVDGWTGLQALSLLQQDEKEIPFILVAKDLETETVDEFMRKGASDCVDKSRLIRLPLAVAIAVERTTLREEQNRVEKALRHSEAHYRALLDNPTYGICRFDVDGRFLEVNDALVTMLGYGSKEDLKAANLATDIVRDPIERAQLFEPYRQTGHIDLIEVEWRRKDGTPMKIRLSGRQVGNEGVAPQACEIIAEDVTAQRAAEDQLRHLAATDALTGLANYRRLSEELESEIKRSDRTGRAFAVLMFDLDGMKQINDRCGHLAGNRALCRLADIFRGSCRSIDTAARYGGDEFAIVLPETNAKDAALVGKRICERLSGETEEPLLSLSVGIAVYPEDGATTDTLLQGADRELYTMKQRKKERIQIRTGQCLGTVLGG